MHSTALGKARFDDHAGFRIGDDTDQGAVAQAAALVGAELATQAGGEPVPSPLPPPPVPGQYPSPETQKHLQAKELMRTLSLVMEKPYWDSCQKTETDPCLMPNIGRTPDIAITIVPDNYTDNLTYPIFIGEILGKKSKGLHLSQRYAGYNATMQSLVFSLRAYY